MLELKHARIDRMVVHKAGNKLQGEGFVIAPAEYELTDGNLEEALLKYFLASFKDDTIYRFSHATDIHLNEVYMYITQAFINKSLFYDQSINVLKHLYENSCHPKVRSGEFYMVYFTDCILDGNPVDAIGIFKTETKDTYIKVVQEGVDFVLDRQDGINLKKLDKGCLIFNSESTDGFRVSIVDNVNKGKEEAVYWKEDFLHVAPVMDNHYHTTAYLDLCKDFAENVYAPVYNADKKDQAVFLHQTMEYFNTNNSFDLDQFASTVLREPELVDQFKEHKKNFDYNQGVSAAEAFDISNGAVKSVKRRLRNIIKLDTGVEIQLKPGVTEETAAAIEKGYDEERGMQYYKIYFRSEE